MDKQIITAQKSNLLVRLDLCKKGLSLCETSEDAMEFCHEIIKAATQFVILVATDKE